MDRMDEMDALAAQSDSAYSYTFLRSVVCLSVVCHIRAPCLNRSTDLNAIWQIHLWLPTAWNSFRSPIFVSGWKQVVKSSVRLIFLQKFLRNLREL